MAENRNITLSLPPELFRRVQRMAADRESSVSAIVIEALSHLTAEDRRYSAVRKRALNAMRHARSLGTGGHAVCSRDNLHAR